MPDFRKTYVRPGWAADRLGTLRRYFENAFAMLRRRAFGFSLFVTGVVTLVLILVTRCTRPYAGAEPLISLEEAAERGRDLGLHVSAGNVPGNLDSRVILSEDPVTLEQAAALTIDDPDEPRWIGRVVVFRSGQIVPHERFTRWGTLWLFGDAELIRRLTGQVMP
jgi:hypothetical protein